MPDITPLPGDPEPQPTNSAVGPEGQPVIPALAPTATTTGLPPNISSALAAFFLLIGGIVFLVLEKKDALTRFWAMQSIVFGGTWLIVRIAFTVVGTLLYHIFAPLSWLWWMLALVVNLGFLAVWIICVIQAFNGRRWEIPFLGPIAREQLTRFGGRL